MDQSSRGRVVPIAPIEVVSMTILAGENPCILCGLIAAYACVICNECRPAFNCLNEYGGVHSMKWPSWVDVVYPNWASRAWQINGF